MNFRMPMHEEYQMDGVSRMNKGDEKCTGLQHFNQNLSVKGG